MMKEKSLKDVTVKLREIYNRAIDAGRKKNWDYAIDLMLNVLSKEPTLQIARQELRKFEAEKSDGLGFISKIFAQIKASIKVPKFRILAKKDPVKAILQYEKLLGEYLYNNTVLNALADAAIAKGAFFISIDDLEIIHDKSPRNEVNLRKLADCYHELKDGMAYLSIFQEIGKLHPNDLTVQSEVRSALAFSTMHKANWETEGSTQDKAHDKESQEAEKLAEGSIHDDSQAEILIEKYTKELEEKESSEIRRKLAEAYSMLGQYEKAIEHLTAIQTNLGSMDPSIDKLIEVAYLSNIDANIKELSKNPSQYESPEEQVVDLQQHRVQYRLKHALERVEIYPNDTQLRYDLALMHFETENFDAALEEFQKARKNPQRKRSCIVYIGRCFENKNQFDMAIDQFTEALADMPEMSNEKMDALYYLGIAHEALEQNDKALGYFKEIYQNNINYKDIAQRIQKHYK
ncbi:MAG: tetratricopeptide repeat protein [Victivallales bacterium]|nr:tetratricopeptide repeat protein [Victivallales bacterium]